MSGTDACAIRQWFARHPYKPNPQNVRYRGPYASETGWAEPESAYLARQHWIMRQVLYFLHDAGSLSSPAELDNHIVGGRVSRHQLQEAVVRLAREGFIELTDDGWITQSDPTPKENP